MVHNIIDIVFLPEGWEQVNLEVKSATKYNRQQQKGINFVAYFFPVLGLPAVFGRDDFGLLLFGRDGVGSS